jgi:hypothetical protein
MHMPGKTRRHLVIPVTVCSLAVFMSAHAGNDLWITGTGKEMLHSIASIPAPTSAEHQTVTVQLGSGNAPIERAVASPGDTLQIVAADMPAINEPFVPLLYIVFPSCTLQSIDVAGNIHRGAHRYCNVVNRLREGWSGTLYAHRLYSGIPDGTYIVTLLLLPAHGKDHHFKKALLRRRARITVTSKTAKRPI